MKRFGIVVALLMVTGRSLHAVSIEELADQMKKAQQQIVALEGKVGSLQQEVAQLQTKLSGWTVSGGNYLLNAGGGSVTIKAGSLLFESAADFSLKAGGSATVQSGSALNVKAGGNALVESSATLTLKGLGLLLRGNNNLALEAPKATIVSSGAIDILASGPLTLKGSKISQN